MSIEPSLHGAHLKLRLLLRQTQQTLQLLVLPGLALPGARHPLGLGLLPDGVGPRGRPERDGGVDGHLLRFVGLQADVSKVRTVSYRTEPALLRAFANCLYLCSLADAFIQSITDHVYSYYYICITVLYYL